MNGLDHFSICGKDAIQQTESSCNQRTDLRNHLKTEQGFPASVITFPSQSQTPYEFAGSTTFSEQEIAESLGWTGYVQQGQFQMPPSHRMHLSSEMTMQSSISPQRQENTTSFHQVSSHPNTSTGAFDSIPIPKTSHGSPAGWQSSLESANFLNESSGGRSRSLGMNHASSVSAVRKEGSTVAEKKAMRRYSHNAVERRRRDNINEQIQELASLVPAGLLRTQSILSPSLTDGSSCANSTNVKPNKGVVLRRSVEYIQLLKNIVEEKAERERQMECEIRRLGGYVPPALNRGEENSNAWVDEFALIEDDD